MQGRECYHCKAWIEPGEAHDCWTTTEAALTRDLPENLLEAWERIRETAVDFGDQRIYASGKAIMFARTRCYFFVRPRVHSLEVCVFLGRTVTSPLIRRADAASRTKIAHIIPITHRDQVEAPFTDWLHEAYETSDALSAPPAKASAAKRPKTSAAPRAKSSLTKPAKRSGKAKTGKTARARRSR